jgi:superfamily II DNA/RNA helicase
MGLAFFIEERIICSPYMSDSAKDRNRNPGNQSTVAERGAGWKGDIQGERREGWLTAGRARGKQDDDGWPRGEQKSTRGWAHPSTRNEEGPKGRPSEDSTVGEGREKRNWSFSDTRGSSRSREARPREEAREEPVPYSVSVISTVRELIDDENKIRINAELVPLTSFTSLASSALRSAVTAEYKEPTVIQKYCIPVIGSGRNLLCRAPTGMGKTMCFLIPIFDSFRKADRPQACIISPTRELCEQIRTEALKIMRDRNIRVVSVYGKKADLPSYATVDIVVATPGRLLDLLNSKRIDFTGLKILVLDEADKLLDMGFDLPLKEIHSFVPQGVQTCLFSATYTSRLSGMIKHFLPGEKISIEVVAETVRTIKQEIVQVQNKDAALLNILKSNEVRLKGSWRAGIAADKILVFVEKKVDCGKVEEFLKRNRVSCVTLHGDKDQPARNSALDGFRDGTYPVLIATSVAARGIDVKDVKLVINYDIPKDIKEYIHRIGRTGRERKTGRAISFCDSGVSKEIRKALVQVLRESGNAVPRFLVGEESLEDRFARLRVAADKEEVSDDETIGLW